MRKPFMFFFLYFLAFSGCAAFGQTGTGATAVWNTLSAPSMDPDKSAKVENLEIVRDRIHIMLVSGVIQFARPANGIVFGSVFAGEGRISVDPPNPMEKEQIKLFVNHYKLDMTFTEATFSFSDDMFDELNKQLSWANTGLADSELYTKRQQEREDLGGEYLPRVFKGILSA